MIRSARGNCWGRTSESPPAGRTSHCPGAIHVDRCKQPIAAPLDSLHVPSRSPGSALPPPTCHPSDEPRGRVIVLNYPSRSTAKLLTRPTLAAASRYLTGRWRAGRLGGRLVHRSGGWAIQCSVQRDAHA